MWFLRRNRSRCIFRIAIALFFLVPVARHGHAQQDRQVGLELVLLVDVSASVSREEYRLQVLGLATAFRSPAILEAVQEAGGIAVCIIQWAQKNLQHLSVDWRHLENEGDVLKFAIEVASMQRPAPSGQTAIGEALKFAKRELNMNRFDGLRRVIDLSGDGRSNDGEYLPGPRREVLESGITINGLAILNEMPDLGEYFQEKLIGGPDSFVMTANDYADFARAIQEKLDREIRHPPLARNPSLERNQAFMRRRDGVLIYSQ